MKILFLVTCVLASGGVREKDQWEKQPFLETRSERQKRRSRVSMLILKSNIIVSEELNDTFVVHAFKC